ncbi:hypothetical protein [Oleiagrimonas sp. MCCC 1A03011]|uniref:hypothetical protein n=1 Tax=Oleiagrimonas sp. MCCC 1A03011 TaxID=1926883 RepID=UPI000DC3D722|nr:hypothetical protein [Oleiagrimonas sp. MCCC 1A03011]RAP57738.1 hypothetical protein BTJ49_07550 [Oleiagrimonas sp. MCCC 1A03011]
MKQITDTPSNFAWPVIALFGVCTLLMWVPALNTPFWGDDYVFLRAAHAASIHWWSDFWPSTPLKFWRPLSQAMYWRVVDGWLDDSAPAAHAVNLGLHVMASTAVALLALATARACKWKNPKPTAALTGVVYGGLAMHILPLHWAAAANNSLLILFTALNLSAWVLSAETKGYRRLLLLVSVPLSLALALLSKESAILTVFLMIFFRLFTGQRLMRKGELATLSGCIVICVIWLILDTRFTTHQDAAYTLKLGSNLIRNTLAFMAWVANVPREALRMIITGDRVLAISWIAATALPMLLALAIPLWRIRARLHARQWLALLLFSGVAYGPYFLLSWNSYAYYAAIAVIMPLIVWAHASIEHPRLPIILALIAASSWVAVAGTRHLDHPGLIGRARWAETMLQDLQVRHMKTPLWVETHDEHRFYAVGRAGLAWRLHLPINRIHRVARCPSQASQCLRIDANGSWRLETTSKHP